MKSEAVKIAERMLEVDSLPHDLFRRIMRVETLVGNDYGSVASRQVIAVVIAQWEREMGIAK